MLEGMRVKSPSDSPRSFFCVAFEQPDDGWSIDLDHLESQIDENTRAILVNNPSNPCGGVFSREHMLQIVAVSEKYRLPIVADEVYERVVSRHLEMRCARCL